MKPEDLKRCLVKDRDTGKICMQIRLGSFTATHELPEAMAGWDQAALDEYFSKVVPEMAERLQEMRQDEQRKLRRRSGLA